YVLAHQPARQLEVATYDVVFGSILHDNPAAHRDLADLGLDPTMATSAGTNILSPHSVARTPLYERFREKVTPLRLVTFYLTHPAHALRTFGWGLEGIARLELDYLGSYMAGSGAAPAAKEHRVPVYSLFWHVFKVAPILLPLLWVALAAVGLSAARRRTATPAERAVGRLAVVVSAMIWTQFAVVLLGEGRVEVTRHMVYVSFLTAAAIPLLALAVRVRLRGVRPRARADISPGFSREERVLTPAG
ncbi:MAG: hypothetical protein HOV86_35910, partial [Thermoactinospora sp.]|nr:hypothetical protein [Thermoactinospora sp.]